MMNAEFKNDLSEQDLDAEQLLAQRHQLEEVFKNKFVRIVTLMFTDLKGSTSLTEREGDLAVRELMRTHNEILFPIIQKHSGKLVKTMGDGTMSYFEDAQSAVLAGLEFQKTIDEYNRIQKPTVPIQVRVGINTGEGIVEKDDVYGDVVNVAARFEAQAEAGEVLFSRETYSALQNENAFYHRLIRKSILKGKKEAVEIFKAFWSDEEIQRDLDWVHAHKNDGVVQETKHSYRRITLWLFLLIGLVFVVMQGAKFLEGSTSSTEKRSTIHIVE